MNMRFPTTQFAKSVSTSSASSRIRGIRAVLLLACPLLLSACVTPYTPFKIPDAQLRDRVRTIAIAPLFASSSLVDREYAQAQIEPIVTRKLSDGGFSVVSSSTVDKLWRRAANDVGAVYDSLTGAIDKERFKTVQEAVSRDLRNENQVDAILYLKISSVDLSMTASTVSYCGLDDDKIYWTGPGASFLERTTLVLALCLEAGLYDMEGRELYGIRHGLETIETYFRQTRAVRPMAERLKNQNRLVEAVEKTLGPLAGAGR